MSEFDEAVALANRVLDRPNADPDDDLAVLARQFLRQKEAVERLEKEAIESHDPYADMIEANRDAVLRKHQEAVRLIRAAVGPISTAGGSQDQRLVFNRANYVLAVLDALNTFHPMHEESWQGWPEGSEA